MTRYEALDPTLDNERRKLRAEWDTTPIGSGSYMQWLEAQVAGLRRDSAGAVSRADDLRATIQDILDTGFNYAEEYRWSLQEALDADAKRGQ